MSHMNNKSHSSLVSQETFFAALAHALGPIMLVVDLSRPGPQSIPFLLATSLILIYHRKRSPFVAHHARQALALQLLGTLGFFILILSGTAFWLVMLLVSIIAVVVLVGLIFIPMVLLTYPLFILFALTLPLSIFILGSLGAWRTANGYDFDYPVLARLLDRVFGVVYVRRALRT